MYDNGRRRQEVDEKKTKGLMMTCDDQKQNSVVMSNTG